MTRNALLAILLSVLSTGPAAGQDLPGWNQADPEAQLEAAAGAPLPAGMGGLLVPCMTDPDAEPGVRVLRDGHPVATGPTGTRLAVPPGVYTVHVGSAGLAARTGEITVTAGQTTLVPPQWAGLRVQVLDANGVAVRGAYELVRLPERRQVGIGFGAQTELGQRLQTWILAPGLYMLLRRGESYLARENFFTVKLSEGAVEHLVLVIDPEDGSFRGAGDASGVAGAQGAGDEPLAMNWVIGAEASLDVRRNVPGTSDTLELGPGLYTDFLLTYGAEPHFVYARAKIDEKFSQEDWGRFEKEMDEARLDAFYAYELKPWFGPYVRGGLETSFFPSYLYFDERTVVVDAEDPTRQLGSRSVFRIAQAGYPLTVKGGAGARFDAQLPPWLDFWTLLGVGGQQIFTEGVYAQDDDPATAELEVRAVDWSGDVGGEARVFLEANPLRWLVLTNDLEVFMPFVRPQDVRFRLDSEVGLRVASMLSVVYSLRLQRRPALSEDLEQTHSVALRIHFKVL